MTTKSLFWTISIAMSLTASVWAGTFGQVVPIGGLASDLALDESRGVLYVANFTANRIDVISLSDNTVQRSMNVASQPSSITISPDAKYLVIAHYGNYPAPAPPSNALTVINLDTNERQTFALGATPLGVAFGNDGKVLVATSTEFRLFDPLTGGYDLLDTVAGVTSKTLPQPAGSFPTTITAASLAASRDGSKIYGLTDTIQFGYDTATHHIQPNSYISSPPMGPRTVSVSQDGGAYTAGWALFDGHLTLQGVFSLISQFPDATGDLSIGSHAIDSSRNLIYAQVPSKGDAATAPKVLQVVSGDNLAVRERLLLAENLTGKSVLNSDSSVMYSISDSGITVFPVGSLDQVSRVAPSQEDVVFRGSFCNRQVASQQITITDLSGGNTDFSIKSSIPGITINPPTGMTPATVRVSVDPNAFAAQKGTSAGVLTITSSGAANLPKSIRVLVNNKEPQQRGAFINVPGKLVDLLADPVRKRFYILRQDTDQVLVFDSTTNAQIATLTTGNTPTQMAITFDRSTLLVGADNSQLLYVYDLDTLQQLDPVRMPGGHYPRSVASAGNTILVANRVAGPKHTIDRVDLASRTATELPSLGVFENNINVNTTLVASPNGSSIMAVQADGTLMLYNATADTFTISRKLGTGTTAQTLSGAYAASNYDQFVVGNNLLNASLVPVAQLGTDNAGGFSFVDQTAYRASSANASSAGVLMRFDPKNISSSTSSLLVEAPVQSDTTLNVFTRTLAPLPDRSGIVALTTSGFTVLPWNYDAAIASPKISSIVNSADFSSGIAPNGLITIFGSNLNEISQVVTGSNTTLQTSCLQVNGATLPLLYVSPTQINAQLPAIDSGTLRLATPGGTIDNYPLNITPAAPAVFRVPLQGLTQPVAAVVRAKNNTVATLSNPVHRGDVLVVYATGLGHTNPDPTPGVPVPTGQLLGVTIAPVVTLGGTPVQVLYAGMSPGQIGVYQINLKVYDNVPLGFNQDLVISQGGNSTSIPLRVVQ